MTFNIEQNASTIVNISFSYELTGTQCYVIQFINNITKSVAWNFPATLSSNVRSTEFRIDIIGSLFMSPPGLWQANFFIAEYGSIDAPMVLINSSLANLISSCSTNPILFYESGNDNNQAVFYQPIIC